MNRYKCIKRWTRNEVGDVVEQWEMNRYPPEIHDHFELIIDKPKVSSPKASDSVSNKTVSGNTGLKNAQTEVANGRDLPK
jgi:hypothetical protein